MEVGGGFGDADEKRVVAANGISGAGDEVDEIGERSGRKERSAPTVVAVRAGEGVEVGSAAGEGGNVGAL